MEKILLADDLKIAGNLTITRFKNGKEVWRSEPMPNKVVSSSGYGRNLLVRALAGDGTYPVAITSASVGSGTNAPADSDTDLQTPVVTGLSITNFVVTNNQLQVDVFATDSALANGTYAEFGLKCSGRLFARILISPTYAKATGEDTLFSYSLPLTG